MKDVSVPQTGNHSHASQFFEIDFRGIVDLIKNGYKLILIIVSIFLIGAIHYARTRPPVYASSALIRVDDSGVGSMLSEQGSSGLQSSLGLATSGTAVQEALLESPYVLGYVADQLGLDIAAGPTSSKKPSQIKVDYLHVPNAFLARALTLTNDGNGRYTLYTPQGVKIGSGVVGQVFSENYFGEPLQIRVAALSGPVGAGFSVEKIPEDDISDGLVGGLDVEEIKEGTGILKLRYSSSTPENAQTILNAILSALIVKNLQQKSEQIKNITAFMSKTIPKSKNEIDKTEDALNTYSVKAGVFDAKAEEGRTVLGIESLKQQLIELKFEKMLLLQKYTPLFPLVLATSQKEKWMQSQIDRLEKKLNALPKITQEEMRFESDLKLQTQLYSGMQMKLQQMQLMKASADSGVKILTSASYPTSPIPVRMVAIVGAGVALGMIVSLGIILIRFMLAPVINDHDEVEHALGVSVIGILPFSQKQYQYEKMAKRGVDQPFLLSQNNPKDVSVEGLRSVRTSLQMLLLEAKDNVLAITSCSPSSGKSFISSNLGKLFADTGKRVLLIDADIRLGKLHKSFGISKMPGLVNYLDGTENDLLLVIQRNVLDKLDKLDVMATGVYPEDPAELLGSDKFETLIQQLKKQYDLIIIDTPPVLAVTDPALLLRHAGVNLMILGVGKDSFKEVLHAQRILNKSHVKLSGLIFNHVLAYKPGYGSYSGYHGKKYSYHYAYGDQ